MQKSHYFVLCAVFLVIGLNAEVYNNDAIPEQPLNQESQRFITFDKNMAIRFLQAGLYAIQENTSLIHAEIIDGTYAMLPSELDKIWEKNTQLQGIESDIVTGIQRLIDILQNEQDNPESSLLIAKQVYDFITFMIAHIRWNICEIQHDGYRSKSSVGWYQSINNEVAQYGIGQTDDSSNGISVSLYHKGKFSLLNPREESLAPLLKRLQFEELARCQHLYNALQAYASWFYIIFGHNETTISIIQSFIKNTEYQFEEHMKCFTLDHIVRFKGKAGILEKLLY